MHKRNVLTFLATAVFAVAALAAPPATKHVRRTLENDPDLREMRDYRLSMDKIQRYVDAFERMKANPSAQCLNSPGNAPTLNDGEKIINACPAAANAIRAAGLKPREFLVLTGALIGDVAAVQMKKGGMIKTLPETVSPENAAFVEQNYDKIQALMKKLNDAAKSESDDQ